MKTVLHLIGIAAAILLLVVISIAQNSGSENSAEQAYLAGKDSINASVSDYYSTNKTALYHLPEDAFQIKIDSLRKLFTSHLEDFISKNPDLEAGFVSSQRNDFHYSFDAYLLGYPYWHERYTGQRVKHLPSIQSHLDANLADFNKPELLADESFKSYVDEFLYMASNLEREKPAYIGTDNQKLVSLFKIIPEYFTNQTCRDYWNYKYLSYYLENIGVKNIDALVKEFNATCKDTSLANKINASYAEEQAQQTGHLIRTYKTIGKIELDLHLFLPDSTIGIAKRPTYVYFHGGAWTEGKPDWGFSACESRAKSGWVAASVEYRINDRHGTLPFDAVMDAKSAIRWLREHAAEYNIDVNRIVATGNSAGGHLVLCTALADKWNDNSDDLHYSATPNLLLVNSGVFDLTNETWITVGLKDKEIVKEISPSYLVKKGVPPTLFIHGTNDRSVPFQTAKVFEAKMKDAGNDFEFHSLEGAGHFLWFDDKYSQEVSNYRREFMKKHGY
jgi:acetyl esterase/lipase